MAHQGVEDSFNAELGSRAISDLNKAKASQAINKAIGTTDEPDPKIRIAFSYQRVSTPDQVQGVGLERQEDKFLPFCERHGLIPNKDRVID